MSESVSLTPRAQEIVAQRGTAGQIEMYDDLCAGADMVYAELI